MRELGEVFVGEIGGVLQAAGFDAVEDLGPLAVLAGGRRLVSGLVEGGMVHVFIVDEPAVCSLDSRFPGRSDRVRFSSLPGQRTEQGWLRENSRP